MSENGTTLENVLEGIVRRVLKEEIGALKAELNGHGNQLLSAKAAAKRWEVPESWIRDMARCEKLPCVRLGHYMRFKPEDLDRFIKERRK